MHLVLDSLKVKDFFSLIVGPADNRRHKPSPDVYLHTSKTLGLTPGECIVIEDSETGVISGKDAGMKVIATPNVYTAHMDFSKADIIVNSLSEVNLDVLNNL